MVLLALLLGGLPLAVAGLLLPIEADPAARRTRPGIPARIGVRATALIAACGVSAMVAFAALHILVWNPTAKLPGMQLAEIYAAMAARGEPPGLAVGWVVAWAAGWAPLVAVFAAVAVLGPRGLLRNLDARRVARLVVLAVVGIGFGHWAAGFSMGMSLADAFGTSGSDAAPGGMVLIAAALFAFAIAVFKFGVPMLLPRPGEAR
ncbi:hypothetical protein [Agromyces archimandritae]|uniref:Uncharacterized protein n=1 Tax=Agromyces archimandritae TaxID=2781962 RepID=A0A975FL98_9MICO|nr:hypothetical protein [Agromyces archimandritae]QTX04179.1 hypothetical protein G127AT_12915 [Agromyces archimandritae]